MSQDSVGIIYHNGLCIRNEGETIFLVALHCWDLKQQAPALLLTHCCCLLCLSRLELDNWAAVSEQRSPTINISAKITHWEHAINISLISWLRITTNNIPLTHQDPCQLELWTPHFERVITIYIQSGWVKEINISPRFILKATIYHVMPSTRHDNINSIICRLFILDCEQGVPNWSVWLWNQQNMMKQSMTIKQGFKYVFSSILNRSLSSSISWPVS